MGDSAGDRNVDGLVLGESQCEGVVAEFGWETQQW